MKGLAISPVVLGSLFSWTRPLNSINDSLLCVFCVEVFEDTILLSLIQVDIEEFGRIEVSADYPWRPKFCSICKSSDHGAQFYPNSKKEWRSVPKKDNGASSVPVNEPSNLAEVVPQAQSQNAAPQPHAQSEGNVQSQGTTP